MLTATIVLLAAAILAFALHRKGDVTLMVKFWGANVLLEAKDAGLKKAGGK